MGKSVEDCPEYSYQGGKAQPTVDSAIPQAEGPGLCKIGEVGWALEHSH